MKHLQFDVIVIGAGHAGSEAAHACYRAGLRVALVTMKASDIGALSCNPAIGGVGKGHIVREIDAMGGIIGKVSDQSAIHYRLLNRRKGPAVRGPRAQMDRQLYHAHMKEVLTSAENIELIFGEVTEIKVEGESVAGVELASGDTIFSENVILTTGTFLGGKIFIGHDSKVSGRMGDMSSVRLRDQLLELGLPKGRLKTGTPPRLKMSTIDWDKLEKQPTDADVTFLSMFTSTVSAAQVDCAITHTNSRTHEIIAANLDKSAMYGGVIESTGPRYCPSIEDKVVRFSEKESHQVFLEPEGLNSELVYPNGISTSLPLDVQYDYVRSMAGLGQAEIVQPGYAVEYNYFDPRHLSPHLEVKDIRGLFFAGQINGTTGYEEAAAQGLAAAISVVSDRAAPIFTRANSYIGVLIDDLISRGVSEPYRMFTSRAEYRLLLRYDNADARLSRIAHQIGVVHDDVWTNVSSRLERLSSVSCALADAQFTPNALAQFGIHVNMDGRKRNCLDLMSDGLATEAQVCEISGLPSSDISLFERAVSDYKYQKYATRHEQAFSALSVTDGIQIPLAFDFGSISGLSAELSSKLSAVRPSTLGHAMAIEGMTPAAGVILLAALKSRASDRAMRS